MTELFIFARFHARAGEESAVDEAAFEHHATLPHTVRFIERVQMLIDHPLDVTRSTALA